MYLIGFPRPLVIPLRGQHDRVPQRLVNWTDAATTVNLTSGRGLERDRRGHAGRGHHAAAS